MVNSLPQLDTSIEIVTPENIAFRYQVAGPFRRLPAYLVDLVIRLLVAFAALLGLSMAFGIVGLGELGMGVAFVAWFLLAWFYGAVLETFFNGQTPGKWLLGLRVLSVDGQPITGLQAVLRNILRFLDGFPPISLGDFKIPLYVLGLGATATNQRFQRLGDLVCGTMVVVEQRQHMVGVVRLQEPEVARMAGLVPASFLPSPTLARALAVYVQRRRNFSWARRMEIARHLAEPLRQRLRLPPGINLDLLLCALYQRTFITEREDKAAPAGAPFQAWPVMATPVDAATAMAAIDRSHRYR